MLPPCGSDIARRIDLARGARRRCVWPNKVNCGKFKGAKDELFVILGAELRSTTAIQVIGCHAEGEVGDVIVGGVAPPPGDTRVGAVPLHRQRRRACARWC